MTDRIKTTNIIKGDITVAAHVYNVNVQRSDIIFSCTKVMHMGEEIPWQILMKFYKGAGMGRQHFNLVVGIYTVTGKKRPP